MISVKPEQVSIVTYFSKNRSQFHSPWFCDAIASVVVSFLPCFHFFFSIFCVGISAAFNVTVSRRNTSLLVPHFCCCYILHALFSGCFHFMANFFWRKKCFSSSWHTSGMFTLEHKRTHLHWMNEAWTSFTGFSWLLIIFLHFIFSLLSCSS